MARTKQPARKSTGRLDDMFIRQSISDLTEENKVFEAPFEAHGSSLAEILGFACLLACLGVSMVLTINEGWQSPIFLMVFYETYILFDHFHSSSPILSTQQLG
jgi:hypothetical protein